MRKSGGSPCDGTCGFRGESLRSERLFSQSTVRFVVAELVVIAVVDRSPKRYLLCHALAQRLTLVSSFRLGVRAADHANGMLALQRTDDHAIMAHATAADGGGFPFPLRGGPPNDPGLLITH